MILLSANTSNAQGSGMGEANSTQDSAFNLVMDEAQRVLSRGNHILATQHYNHALELKPNDPRAMAQLKIIANFTAGRQINMRYANLIAKADLLYISQAYDSATFYYSEAYRLQPNEQYPVVRIAEIVKEIRENKMADSIQLVEEEAAKKRELLDTVAISSVEEIREEGIKEMPEEGGPDDTPEVEITLSAEEISQEIRTKRSAEAFVEVQSVASESVVLQNEMERETEKLTFNEMKNNVSKAKSKKLFLEEIAESKRRIRIEGISNTR